MHYPRTALDSAYEWYTSGPRQRLQPGGKIVLVMTRWSTRDLTGRLINNQKEPKSDQWHVVEFPAIMDHEPVWPQYWTIEELEKVQSFFTCRQMECTMDAESCSRARGSN